MRTQLTSTSDGSSTLFVPELKEHYHSINGAVQESMHVFIEAGFKACEKKSLSIFEMGFGTGLNTLLTYLEAGKHAIDVNYFTLEKYPLTPELVAALNYPAFLQLSTTDHDSFLKMHSCEWNRSIEISAKFRLCKSDGSLLEFNPDQKFDLVYFDAFAPEVQPELWKEEIFRRLYESLTPGGIFITYCAKGQVRRDLQSCGFTVERLPGPPGKREMLRGSKNH
jgi:tRNA U34 5-methylaminomethyl-2-thiouridine-forming methyltransferase MnmC